MRGRLEDALRAGCTTLLMGFLVSAALLALLLASEQTFAHHHPDGTRAHLHAFELFVGNGLPVPPTAASSMQRHAASAPQLPLQPWASLEPQRSYESRAPPRTIS